MNQILRQFIEQAQAVQTQVASIGGWEEAIRFVVRLTSENRGKTIAPWGMPEEAIRLLEEEAQREELEILHPPLRIHGDRIFTGFTTADWGIAETGTLVMDSTPEDLRLATMLSEIHVAVLPENRIRWEALELAQELSNLQKTAPRYLAFVSGASRTADIERVLTIGVHGPQELHVLILQEETP